MKNIPFLVISPAGTLQHSGVIGGPIEPGFWLVQFNPQTPTGAAYRKVVPTAALQEFTLFENNDLLQKFVDDHTKKPVDSVPDGN